MLLAAIGAGAAALHAAKSLRIPAMLATAVPGALAYRLVRSATMRISMRWVAILLILPVAVYETVQLVPSLLSITSDAIVRNWQVQGPTLASWLLVTILLVAVLQFLALRQRGRPYHRQLGWYLLATFTALMLWYVSLWYPPIGVSPTALLIDGVLLAAAVWLCFMTRRSPADFSERITGE